MLSIRDVPGIAVGHATDPIGVTGCTTCRMPAPDGLGELLSLGAAAVETMRTAIESSVAVA